MLKREACDLRPSGIALFILRGAYGSTDSIVIGFHSWIFIQSEETEGANSELFKEDVDDAMYKNSYEI